jgi:tRNA A64-2'-O-ribosylphosphate transferase
VHLPVWVLGTEKNAIEGRIDEWTDQFESCGADINSLAIGLQKPLRPLWISQRTRIWLNEVPELESWDFTPIILISTSASEAVATQRMSSEFSWHYIPGAGDDEESWARGLTPTLFWKHSYDLLDAGPDHCNQLVADIVEKDRVYRSQRGEHCPQITSKSLKSLDAAKCNDDQTSETWAMNLDPCTSTMDAQCSNSGLPLFWIGTSNLAVSSTFQGMMNNWALAIFCIACSVVMCHMKICKYMSR